MNEPLATEQNARMYAGFWRRIGAWTIDGLVMQVIFLLLGAALFFSVPEDAIKQLVVPINMLTLLVFIAYEPLMESSRYQATLGKLAAGVKVTNTEGQRIGFWQALGRRLAMLLSALPLCIGFIIAAFTKRKQALHDLIAGTTVVMVGRSYFWRIMAITFVLYIAVMASAGYYVAHHLGAWISKGFNSGAVVVGETMKAAEEHKIVPEELSKNAPVWPYNYTAEQYEAILATRSVDTAGIPKYLPTVFPAKPIALQLSNFFDQSLSQSPSQWLEAYAAPETNLARGGYATVKIDHVLNAAGADLYDPTNAFKGEIFHQIFDSIEKTEVRAPKDIYTITIKKDTKETDIISASGTLHLFLPINPKVITITGANVGKPLVISPTLQILVQQFGNGIVSLEASGTDKKRLLKYFYPYNAAGKLLMGSGPGSMMERDKITYNFTVQGTPTSAQLVVAEKFFEKEYPFTVNKFIPK